MVMMNNLYGHGLMRHVAWLPGMNADANGHTPAHAHSSHARCLVHPLNSVGAHATEEARTCAVHADGGY